MSKTRCPEGLVYVGPQEEGFARIRRGRGFSYHDATGKKITDDDILARIKSLGIPPAWKDVWISQNPKGHLQATGYDLKNRKQYRYHPEWTEYRQLAKFSKLRDFGLKIPGIRFQTYQLLKQHGWPKEKVLALVIQMLDEYHIRIGNEYYKEHNETFGLTTMRRKHLDFEKGVGGRLEYKAKSGKYRKISLHHNQLAKLVKECSELPGYEIFTYRDENNKFQSIDSHDVNAFLHELAGEQFSSKDFRTWGGTTLLIEKEEEAREAVSENKRLKLETSLVRAVASSLGNTVSICRNYYIHPEVMKHVMAGEVSDYLQKSPSGIKKNEHKLFRKSEIAVLNILEDCDSKMATS